MAVHDADQTRDVMRQFGAAPVAIVIDEGKVVLQTYARTDRNYRRHQRRQTSVLRILRRVIRSQKRAAIEKQPARQAAPAHHANGIGAMSLLGARLRQLVAVLLDMTQRGILRDACSA